MSNNNRISFDTLLDGLSDIELDTFAAPGHRSTARHAKRMIAELLRDLAEHDDNAMRDALDR